MFRQATSIEDFKEGLHVQARVDHEHGEFSKGDQGTVVKEAKVYMFVDVRFDSGVTTNVAIPTTAEKLSSGDWAIGTRVRAVIAVGEKFKKGDEGEAVGLPWGVPLVVISFKTGVASYFAEQNAVQSLHIAPPPGTRVMFRQATSIEDFKEGLHVQARVDHKEGEFSKGDQGTVVEEAAVIPIVKVRFDSGVTTSVAIPDAVEKLSSGDWAVGTRVRAVITFGEKFKKGDEGEAVDLPWKTTLLRISFKGGESVFFTDEEVLTHLEIAAPQAGAPMAVPATPSPPSPATKVTIGAEERKHNRWGDGLDAPAAGAREFFPNGWVPSRDAFKAIEVFGHSTEAIAAIRAKGEQLERELELFGISTAPDHASAVFAYTQEDPTTDLYRKLNAACRTSGGTAERRLAVYRDYMHHLQEALASLPSYRGTAYRGIGSKVSPVSYGVGKSITWQAFASASKSQNEARRFVVEQKGQLSGSMFILEVKNAREVEMLSAIPTELEVVLKLNTFFTVEKKLEGDAAKHLALPDLAGYGMADLDVYLLKQL